MIIGVTLNDVVEIDVQSIRTISIHDYAYGVARAISIGVDGSWRGKIGGEYLIVFDDGREVRFVLHEILPVEYGGESIINCVFIEGIISKILNNELPVSAEVFSISFRSYVKERNNQMEYLVDGLRRKGLILVPDIMTGRARQSHIEEHLFDKEVSVNFRGHSMSSIDNDTESRRFNYYSLANGEAVRTNSGKDFPIFRPFLSKSDIRGLDGYLLAKKMINAGETMLEIGDAVLADGIKHVVMEKELFINEGGSKSVLILGVRG